MTIELSPPAATPSKASEAHAAKSKPKAGASGAGSDAPASGFLAILGALGDDSDGAAAGDALPTATDSTALPGTVLDANTLLLQNPQIGAAMAGVGADAAGQGVDAKALAASLASASSVKGAGVGQALDAKGARPLRPDAAEGQGQSAVAKDALLNPEGPATASHATGHAKTGKDSLPTATDSTAASASNATPAAAAERKDALDARLMAALEQARNATSAKTPEPVATAALANRSEKSSTERAAANTKGADPTYTGTSVGVSGPDFSQGVSASAAAATPDMQVAEQVTYWVSHNVQNAEMKLDGLGKSPVEVSISVQGNEAQIAFRSDEAQTRGVLESAGMHLKDMLQREGMVLTGVSVGTSGSGDSGAGERRGRQSARQTVIAPLQPAAAPAAARTGAAAGRSVDLFV